MSDVKLSDVLARRVVVDWHEGVAVVRAVAVHLLSAGTQLRAVPELHQVVLYPTGQLEVTGGTSADEPVRRLGQLLQAMLGTAEPPVQLRLLISQATAPTPGFNSMEDFDAALGYYERPNRESVIQGLYERAAALPPPTETQPPPRLDVIAPLPTNKPQRVKPVKPKRKIHKAPVVLAVVLILVAAGSFYYLKVSGLTSSSGDVSALAKSASEAVGSAVVSGVSAVTERVGLGKLVSSDAPPSPAPSTAPPAGDIALTARATGPQQPLTTLRAFDLDPAVGTALPEIATPTRTRPNAPSEEFTAPVGGGEIYSTSSAGVTPPVTRKMHFPKSLPADVKPGELGRVELIIGPDGMVDSVKLLGAPRNVLDSMALSAIKAWEFEPAMKNGFPVRYRKTFWITAQ